MDFKRNLFYNITDVTKTFKISSKAYQSLLKTKGIKTVVRDIDHGTYSTTALYALKDDIDSLGLERRVGK